MGILDGIVDWLATQVMNLLDLASTSVLGALDCNMDTFKRYFPAASAMYEIFIWTAIGLVLLNLVWQLYRCYGAGFDIDTENPTNLVVRSVIFLLLIWYCDDIVNLALQIGGTPYNWILDSTLHHSSGKAATKIQQHQPDGRPDKNLIHGRSGRKVPLECVHIAAQRTEFRCGCQIQQIHYLRCQPIHNAI